MRSARDIFMRSARDIFMRSARDIFLRSARGYLETKEIPKSEGPPDLHDVGTDGGHVDQGETRG
jgi:hypothetical protein